MTDKLITHNEAREKLSIVLYELTKVKCDYQPSLSLTEIINIFECVKNTYITQQEQRDKDVARYFELRSKPKNISIDSDDDLRELWALEEKLTKGVTK